MRVMTVVGARPQFIKAAAVSRALRREHAEVMVHTGQHYDASMSAVFFEELGIPQPNYNLEVGSGPHGAQTGAMLERLEPLLMEVAPDWVLVYGDTNSTLAGALAAVKLRIPVVHVEAGLRSFNRLMPEEINRVLVDHVSDLLLCPSATAVQNLAAEGVVTGVDLVGDVMADVLREAIRAAEARSTILQALELVDGAYLLATVHRAENADDPCRLRGILRAFAAIGEPIVFPVHPRTREWIEKLGDGARLPRHVRLVEPLGYLDLIRLERSARLILTDSGGMQKEAYWLGVPCVTLRDETEWVETLAAGWNVLAGADCDRIVSLVRSFAPPAVRPPLYGDGFAAARCVAALERSGGSRSGPNCVHRPCV